MGTFSDVVTQVLRRLEEDTSSPTHWTTAEVEAAVNEAQDEIAEATEWFEDRVMVPLQPRTYYDIRDITRYVPLRVTKIFNLYTKRWLIPATHQELGNANWRWEAEISSQPEYWFPRSPFIIGIHPKVGSLAFPDTQVTNTFINLHYHCIPPAMSGTASLRVQQRFEKAYIEYALYDLSMQDGEIKLGLRYFGRFVAILANLGVQYDKPAIIPNTVRLGNE